MIRIFSKLSFAVSLACVLVSLSFGLNLLAQKEKGKLRGKIEKKPTPMVKPPEPDPLPLARAQEPMVTFQSPVTEMRLENGLKVILQEINSRPIVSVGCWYRVGSKDDPAGAAGISHWVEHMNFLGTESYSNSQLTALLDESGSSWNGYTFLDQTTYFETVVPSRLEEILRMEASRMTSTLFDSKAVESERQIAIWELKDEENNPRNLLDVDVTATALRLHPYRWPANGSQTDLESISREQLLQHYRQYYTPNNAVLVLVGSFETKKVQDLIQKHFGRISRKADPVRPRYREPEPQGERRVKVVHEGSVSALQLAYRAPDILNDDFYALLILDAVLNGAKGINVWATSWDAPARKSSRLYRALVDRKLATDIRSRLIPTQSPYLFRITATLPDAFQFQPAEEAILEQLERLKTYELSDGELAKAKNQLITREFLDQDSVSKRAHQLAYFESIASHKVLENFEEKVSRVSKDDLRRVAIRYLSENTRTIGWLVPAPKKQVIEVEKLSAAKGLRNTGSNGCCPDLTKGPNSASAVPPASPGSRLFSRPAFMQTNSLSRPSAANLPAEAPAGAIPRRTEALQLKPVRKTLANGVTVLVVENRFSPTVTVHASMKAGAMWESDAQAGVARLTAQMLEHGTARRNVFRLAEDFDFLGADLSIETDYLSATTRVQGLSKDVAAFLQLLAEMFQNPAFPSSELELVRSEVLGELQEESVDPRRVADLKLRERIYPQGHPFRRPMQGTLKGIESARLNDVISFYKRHYRPDRLSLSIAGDVRAETAFEVAEKVFGRWAASGSAEPFAIAAAPAGLGAGEERVELAGNGLCEVVLGITGISIRHPDYYPLLILSQIFGQSRSGGRLGSRFPHGDNWTSSIQTQFDANLTEGPFTIRVAVVPTGVERAVESIREEARKIKELGVTAQEAASAKSALIHAWPVRLDSNESIARQLSLMELYELGEDYFQRYPELIEGVTMESLLDCARTRFAFEQGALVIAGPSQKR